MPLFPTLGVIRKSSFLSMRLPRLPVPSAADQSSSLLRFAIRPHQQQHGLGSRDSKHLTWSAIRRCAFPFRRAKECCDCPREISSLHNNHRSRSSQTQAYLPLARQAEGKRSQERWAPVLSRIVSTTKRVVAESPPGELATERCEQVFLY